MKMDRWSDYEKYIVMLTSYNSTAKGVSLGYQAFLDFKRVKEEIDFKTKEPTGRKFTDYPFVEDVQIDGC